MIILLHRVSRTVRVPRTVDAVFTQLHAALFRVELTVVRIVSGDVDTSVDEEVVISGRLRWW